jgi:hypothetical protein
MTEKKKSANSSFISAIASNLPLNMAEINKEGTEISKEEEEVRNTASVEITRSSTKKKQSEKHLEFIASILKSPNTEHDKGYIYIAGLTHQRLKKLSIISNVSLYELTDSIINDFFEKNKENIDVLIKKSTSF